ncbi:MAG: TonB-dependent receptor [Deltaproteobacteria bacterium]|nr:TonB-dependent receptor [Deltaproteobacteria bacterium]
MLATSAAPSIAAAQPAAAAPKLVPPKLVHAPDVPYPAGATGDAEIVLELLIDEKGEVASVRVESGDEPFAAQAAEGAKSFRFEPATREGAPMKAKIRYKLSFKQPAAEPPKPAPEPPKPAPAAPAPAPKPKSALKSSEPTEITVLGEKPAPTVSTFSRAEVRELPGAFGDPFRAIESLPGVTPIVSGLPFFFVRGAPPGNVGYFLDGVRVPYLYHVALGPSVIHPGMVDRVDLYPGGYPARFGRFAGGIVSGEATAPVTRAHGEGNIRLFDAGAMVETGFAGGKGTVLLGGRYSYTAALLSLIAKNTILDYRDFQARVTYDLGPKDRITAFAFGAFDLLAERQQGTVATLFGSEFYRLDMRWDHAFSEASAMRWAVTLGFDQTKLGETRNVQDRILGTRVELRHAFGKGALLRGGADVTTDAYSATRPRFIDPESPDMLRTEQLFPPRTDFAGGVWADVLFTPSPIVEITPGVRADVFRQGTVTKGAIDPRISARFKVSDRVKIVHAYGIAHQAPSFVVPVPGLAPASLANGLQSAWQASAGVELTLPEDIHATATAFYNAFFDMTDAIGSSTGSPQEGATADRRSRGRAVGFELFIRRRLTKRLGGFISYTLSRSTREIDGQTFVASFDRTHVASAALAYDLGKRWRIGSRFTFYTGAPVIERSGGLIPPPPTLTPDRDPPFYRLDVRLEKRWMLGSSGAWISFVAEMLNATLHKETISGRTIGPVSIPSVGVEGGF